MRGSFNAYLLLMSGGVVFGLTSLMAWGLLYRRHRVLPLTLWTLWGVCCGVGFVLLVDRSEHPR